MITCPCCEAHRKEMLRVWDGLDDFYAQKLIVALAAAAPAPVEIAALQANIKVVIAQRNAPSECPLRRKPLHHAETPYARV